MFELRSLRRATVLAAVGLCVSVGFTIPPVTAQAEPGRAERIGLLDPAWSFGKAAAAFDIVYTTRDQRDAPAQASAGLYVPQGIPPQGGWPLVVWAHGTVGIADTCAPSRRPQSERNTTYFNELLARGYAVLAPDYQGLGTPGQFSYYSSNVEGMSIIDAVAAVRTTPVPLSRKWVAIGQSEGAHAVMSAAGRYADHADGPAAGLSGVIATGLRANTGPSLREMFQRTATGSANQVGYAAYFLASLLELYPDRVAPYLSDFGREYIAKAATECLSDLVARADKRRPSALVADPGTVTPTFESDIAALAGYREDRFTTDILIGYGTADIDVAPTYTDGYARALQEQNPGVRIQVESYQDKDHSGAFLASLPDALAFLASHLRNA
ncbi:alpha/beta hydrolase family protein [Nocardia sp. NPDC052566]|uniref:alpha/beta hydrolase family protein n=1 Tax=Nocardia sp. NPDC052566 TaxID=3364330 RepID=UPI0037CCA8E5